MRTSKLLALTLALSLNAAPALAFEAKGVAFQLADCKAVSIPPHSPVRFEVFISSDTEGYLVTDTGFDTDSTLLSKILVPVQLARTPDQGYEVSSDGEPAFTIVEGVDVPLEIKQGSQTAKYSCTAKW